LHEAQEAVRVARLDVPEGVEPFGERGRVGEARAVCEMEVGQRAHAYEFEVVFETDARRLEQFGEDPRHRDERRPRVEAKAVLFQRVHLAAEARAPCSQTVTRHPAAASRNADASPPSSPPMMTAVLCFMRARTVVRDLEHSYGSMLLTYDSTLMSYDSTLLTSTFLW
jgi:hypothetical protein